MGRTSRNVQTARYEQIAELICIGLTSSEIGAQLGISGRTIELYRQRMMINLGANNASHLVTLLHAEKMNHMTARIAQLELEVRTLLQKLANQDLG